MNLQYAAGYTGDFRMAFACGGTTQNDLSAASFTCCALEAELVVPTYQMGVAASLPRRSWERPTGAPPPCAHSYSWHSL